LLKVKTTSKEIEQWGNSLRTYVYLMCWLQSIAKISAIATAAAAVLGIFLVSWIPVIITGSIFVVSFLLSFIAAGMRN
jgi:hypothetical protein